MWSVLDVHQFFCLVQAQEEQLAVQQRLEQAEGSVTDLQAQVASLQRKLEKSEVVAANLQARSEESAAVSSDLQVKLDTLHEVSRCSLPVLSCPGGNVQDVEHTWAVHLTNVIIMVHAWVHGICCKQHRDDICTSYKRGLTSLS